jgi:hypothetical protein
MVKRNTVNTQQINAVITTTLKGKPVQKSKKVVSVPVKQEFNVSIKNTINTIAGTVGNKVIALATHIVYNPYTKTITEKIDPHNDFLHALTGGVEFTYEQLHNLGFT